MTSRTLTYFIQHPAIKFEKTRSNFYVASKTPLLQKYIIIKHNYNFNFLQKYINTWEVFQEL
jgi:hypothetical protein